MKKIASSHKGTGKIARSCKICSLLKTHPELYSAVHERVMEDDYAVSAVIRWLNSEVSFYNAQLPADASPSDKLINFNSVNFNNHFTKHVTKASLIAKDIRKTMANAGVDISNVPSKMNVHDIASEDFLYNMTEELTDYTDITKMVNTMETLLWRYHDETLVPNLKPGEKPRKLSISQIKEFENRLSALADMKIKLSRLRNSSFVAGSAVKRAVAMSVEMFMNSMLSITQEAAESFKEANPDSVVGDAIIDTMRNKMKEQIKFALKEIIDETFEEFHIK